MRATGTQTRHLDAIVSEVPCLVGIFVWYRVFFNSSNLANLFTNLSYLYQNIIVRKLKKIRNNVPFNLNLLTHLDKQ